MHVDDAVFRRERPLQILPYEAIAAEAVTEKQGDGRLRLAQNLIKNRGAIRAERVSAPPYGPRCGRPLRALGSPGDRRVTPWSRARRLLRGTHSQRDTSQSP